MGGIYKTTDAGGKHGSALILYHLLSIRRMEAAGRLEYIMILCPEVCSFQPLREIGLLIKGLMSFPGTRRGLHGNHLPMWAMKSLVVLAFTDGNNGLMSWGDYNPASWWRTTDGGHSWNTILFDSTCWQPLAIKGTQTYFAMTPAGAIFRTDNGGDTWDSLYTFPPQNCPQNYSTEGVGVGPSQSSSCIRGTLDEPLCGGGYGVLSFNGSGSFVEIPFKSVNAY